MPIRRAPEDVFGLFIRFDEIPRYVPQIASAGQVTPGEVGVGTVFVQRSRLLGRSVEIPTVVTTFDPPTRFGYRTDRGPLPYEALYVFTPSDGGTLLDARVTARPRGIARALKPVIARLTEAVYARNLDRLRELLEKEG